VFGSEYRAAATSGLMQLRLCAAPLSQAGYLRGLDWSRSVQRGALGCETWWTAGCGRADRAFRSPHSV